MKTQDNISLWSYAAYNARGQTTGYHLGDAYEVTRGWDGYGFPSQIVTRTITSPDDRQRDDYIFDEKRGNLMQRSLWEAQAHFENFRYDKLNRLRADSLGSTDYRNTSYYDNGNIDERTDIGVYHYTGVDAGPHAVNGLSNTVGNLLPATSQTVDYTAFNKASHISQGNLDYFITYGPDRLRRKTVLQSGMTDETLLTKYYALGDFEKEIDADRTRHLHYISAGDGLAVIYVKNDGGVDSLYFILKDHLGSIVAAINNETGKVYRQSFDAWGRARNPEDWTYTNIPDFIFDRGYTGHEHLKWFGLINMNGRMYDAALCRFLSPDPYVQMPDNSQNFNRYSYCLNNPLVFTDPTGEFPVAFAIGFVIGAYLGGMSSNDWKMNPRDWEMNTNTFLAMGFGGLAGGFGGQYLFGAGGVLSGGTPLNIAVGSNIGNVFNAGANFVVSNGGVMMQGLGYTTVAGGGAYFLNNQYQGQNYQQMVDQEIYSVQEEYRNEWFKSEPGYRPADLGAVDYMDQMAYSLSYAKRFGYGMSMNELFDYSNASNNFTSIPGQAGGKNNRHSKMNDNINFEFFDGDNVTFSGLRYYAEGGKNIRDNYPIYSSINLSKSNFPKVNIYGEMVKYPYALQVTGYVDLRRHTVGTFRFSEWEQFKSFNEKVLNGPPKGYWFNY